MSGYLIFAVLVLAGIVALAISDRPSQATTDAAIPGLSVLQSTTAGEDYDLPALGWGSWKLIAG